LYTTVIYGCGDASGTGLGSAFVANGKYGGFDKFDNYIAYRIGVLGLDVDEESSNYRELQIVVEAIYDQIEKGRLRNLELFMFTDNSTAEAAFYWGTSSNPALFELVLQLKKSDMSAGLKINLIHVSRL
jgi:hypothetical protein